MPLGSPASRTATMPPAGFAAPPLRETERAPFQSLWPASAPRSPVATCHGPSLLHGAGHGQSSAQARSEQTRGRSFAACAPRSARLPLDQGSSHTVARLKACAAGRRVVTQPKSERNYTNGVEKPSNLCNMLWSATSSGGASRVVRPWNPAPPFPLPVVRLNKTTFRP